MVKAIRAMQQETAAASSGVIRVRSCSVLCALLAMLTRLKGCWLRAAHGKMHALDSRPCRKDEAQFA